MRIRATEFISESDLHLEVTSCPGWSLVQCRVADSVSETTESWEVLIRD